jgi:hypothetical protein
MQAIRCVVFCLVAALLLGFGSAAAEDSDAYPTEISDPATYVPDQPEVTAPDDEGGYPTEISDPATYVPETPDATVPADDDGDRPTEISDAVTVTPETPEATVAGISTGGTGTTSGPQTLAVQQLPNAGSGTSDNESLPWLVFVALAAFAGTMVIRIRRASRNA